MELYPYQKKAIEDLRKSFAKGAQRVVLCLPTGGGKCLSGGTEVIMSNGRPKKVEDIVQGEYLMGVDGTHRKVLSTCTGVEQMYRITLRNGDFFECNESHILSLICNANHSKRFYKKSIHNISIKEYLSLPKSVKHVLKSYKTSIELPEQDVELDPYILGVWLGDGDSNGTTITNMDTEVEEQLYIYAEKNNLLCVKRKYGDTQAFRYTLKCKKMQWYGGLRGLLHKYNLFNNKHIPDKFLYTSRKQRLRLLAGLLDADGYLGHNCFELFVGHKQLGIDVIYLVRSLGFSVHIGHKKGVEGVRLSISGENLEEIPMCVERKKANKRAQIKDALLYGFTVEKKEVGVYYGFSLDGDRRFILGDFTVTHNTVVFTEMVRLAYEKGTKILVLTDRTELFKQAVGYISSVAIPVEEIHPDRKHVYKDGLVYVGMVETLKRRKKQLYNLNPRLIIADEAHMGNFTPIFELFPDAKVIGATATPVGNHFYEYYQDIVQTVDVPELVSDGFLVPCKPYQMVGSFDDLKKQRGEFTFDSLYAHYNKPILYQGVVENWRKYAEGKKTIVFCVNIEHTENTYTSFIDAGISAERVSSKTSKEERERILDAYHNNKFTVLVNCGILTKGYNEPSIECVVMNRATSSIALWLQCCGRGSRTFPGKKEFILLDFGGNHERLGLWNEPRTWKLKKKKETTGEAPCKVCPQCLVPTYTTAKECIECKFIFPINEKEKNKEGIMVEVLPHIPKDLIGKRIGELTIAELIQLQKAKKYKSTYIWRIIRSKGERALYEYAQKIGYSDGWVYGQINKLSENDFNNYILS